MSADKVNNDPYAAVARGKLQLKGDDNGIKKKKKKRSTKKTLEQISKFIENSESEVAELAPVRRKTKAELAYLTQQEKMQTQRILEKASITHKERVEKFNQHLDGLTEHFDIPKVSWTK